MELRNILLFSILFSWNSVKHVHSQEDAVLEDKPSGSTTRSRIHSEAKLREKLFGDYDRKVRPSGNLTDTVSVYVSMMLLHIEGVEEERQVLKIHTWMGFKWNDVRLKWNSTAYSQITVLHTADEELWLPDTSLYNNAEGKDIHNYGSTTIMIQSNGDVLWIPPASFSAQCNMTFDTWPNDAHQCTLSIGSWTQHGWDLDLHLDDQAVGIDLSNYVKNDQWQLISVSAKRALQIYSCCPEPYVSLSFGLHIRRNPSHYIHTLVNPTNTLLLSSCCLFVLPDFRFRLITGLIQILAFCGESVFLWTVVPPTYGTPPVVRLISSSIGCVFYALVLCLVLEKVATVKHAVPKWIRTEINPRLGSILGLVSSKYFKPKRVSHHRGVSGAENDKDSLKVEYETDEQGKQQTVAGDDSATQLADPQNSWRIFSEILSRIFLIHYVILTIVVIALHL